jgi:diguanylate cyclase (GGDEF)-like protein
MLQLSSHNIIQFSCFVIYAILIVFILNSKQMKLKKQFLLFLAPAAGACLSGILTTLRQPYEELLLWKMLVIPLSTWAVVGYAHFITAYAGQNTRKIVKLGYGWLAVTSGMVIFGYFAQGITFLDIPLLTAYYGHVIDALVFVNVFFIIPVAFLLFRVLKNTGDPEERNRTAYLLAGLGLLVPAYAAAYILRDYKNTFANIGFAGNAIIITYTLLKYRLLNIQQLMKKWVTYTFITVSVTLAYLAMLLILSNLLRLLPPHLGIPATVIMVVLFAYLFNWLKTTLDRAADRLFYGNRYLHRKMLLDFAEKTSTFINIEDIANALLGPLVKVIRAGQIDLLLPTNGLYCTKFVARLSEEEEIVPLVLPRSGPVVHWLETQGVLPRSMLVTKPEFSGLAPEETGALSKSRYELLCPVVSKGTLVAVLALGQKQNRGHFSRDDIDLVATLSKESAVAIENAQIYARAKEKADTDELTGLRNHRYFQERFTQEIEKSTLSDGEFALLFIDLDFFKTYNDIYGHMLGDEILKEVGKLIQNSIRATDIGARYGGDEFAAILLNTSAEGAVTVAERIREGLQTSMEQKGIMLTCSIGIACWRVDGIKRETLIEAADKALYAAKAAGRNRVLLASQSAQTARPENALKEANDTAVENIVYALAATVDTRDHYTFGHSKAVSRYATELAAAAGYTREGIKRIQAAALLHDIGKLSIPDSILAKSGPLTDAEWTIIQRHPEMGVGILKYIVGLRGCVDAVLYHHERYDGRGYPRGLKGTDIPLDARIMAIADSYDAMTSERSYKERRMTEEEAILELKNCAGTQFDPVLVETFISLRKKASSLISGLEAA